jgi:hypothetical protein
VRVVDSLLLVCPVAEQPDADHCEGEVEATPDRSASTMVVTKIMTENVSGVSGEQMEVLLESCVLKWDSSRLLPLAV